MSSIEYKKFKLPEYILLALFATLIILQENGFINLNKHVTTNLGKFIMIVLIVLIISKYGFPLGITSVFVALYLLNGSVKEGMNGMVGDKSMLEDVDFTKNPDSNSSLNVHKSNDHDNLYYFIPPKSNSEIEKTRLDNKKKVSSSDRLFIEELLSKNKIDNIIINFNRGNKNHMNRHHKVPYGNIYRQRKYATKLKKDPYSCSV